MGMKDKIIPENPIDLVPLTDPLDDLCGKLIDEISVIKKTPLTGALSPAGRQRFQRNCQVIGMVQKSLTARNLAILQVYEEEQWKEEFPTVIEFAKAIADMSKQQLFKVLDQARVHYVFANSGLLGIRPTGRCREELVKVDEDHWIPAWEFTLDMCKDDGVSQSLARDALRDYCRDHGIYFGRRLPNGTSLRLPPPNNSAEADEEPQDDWKTKLTPDMKKAIRCAVGAEVVESIETSFANKSAENVILDSILSLEPSKFGPEDAVPWKELLRLIHHHEPEIYQTLILLALEHCTEVIGNAVMVRCHKNLEGNANRRSKRSRKRTNNQKTSSD